MEPAFERLGVDLAEFARRRDFSGTAAITVAGRSVFQACYGLANRADDVPIRPGTRFGLASVTKMFTAVAVADLVGTGSLEFDRPVLDVLPPERRPRTLRPDVTVAHLLSHTSGIADYFEEEDDDADYARLWTDRPTYTTRRPADFLPLFGDLPPYRPPGQQFQYSNAGYIVLGLVIEEIAQQPYADVVTRRVFARAGMADSGFFALDEVRPDVAVGYLAPATPDGLWRSNVFAMPIIGGADGGAFSTVADLDRFLRAYDDGTLVGTELRDAMLTPRTPVDPGLSMGYGVMIYEGGRTWRFGHAGGDPGVEVFVMRFPDLDVSAFVLCNVEGCASEVRDLLVQAVVDAV
jgi:CubicO group peptidase (beta-lactamase class C family)